MVCEYLSSPRSPLISVFTSYMYVVSKSKFDFPLGLWFRVVLVKTRPDLDSDSEYNTILNPDYSLKPDSQSGIQESLILKAVRNNKFGFLVSDLWLWLELLYSFNLVQSSLNVTILSCMRSGSPDSWFLIWILVQENIRF